MSSHLVPALRALLPVAFLCEVRAETNSEFRHGNPSGIMLYSYCCFGIRCSLAVIYLYGKAARHLRSWLLPYPHTSVALGNSWINWKQ